MTVTENRETTGGWLGTAKQVLAATIVGQGLVCNGINFGMHSVTLIQVPADPENTLSDDQLNWTIAGTLLGGMLGCLLAMPVAPLLGARRLLLLTMPVYVLGAVAAGLGNSFVWLLLGRMLIFVALQMSEGTVRGYVSEIVPPNRRTLFVTFLNGLVSVGQVLSLVLGRRIHWQTLFLTAACVPPVICVCGVLFLPDSPKWLLARGRSTEEARRSVLFYHPDADADAEVHNIKDSLAHTEDGVSTWRLLRQPETAKPVLLGSVQIALFAWSGGQTMILITATILEPAQLPLDNYQRSIIVPALAILLCVPSFPIIERFGRLTLLRLAGAVMTVGCSIVATFFFLSAETQEHLGWMALVGAAVVVIPFFCIIGPISFGYVSELLPNNTRALGSNIVMTSVNVCTFVLLKVYPSMQNGIGLGGAFVVHAAMNVVQVLFATFCLVETRGLSLEQVQRIFQRGDKAAEFAIHMDERTYGAETTCDSTELPQRRVNEA